METKEGVYHKACENKSGKNDFRLHVCLDGRYVTLFRHDGKYFCLDSTCHHTGGPLGLGDIEDVHGKACVVCPWHRYQVSLKDGSKFYQPLEKNNDGKLLPGEGKWREFAQRTHEVQSRKDGIYVKLNLVGDCASDRYGSLNTCLGNGRSTVVMKNQNLHSNLMKTRSGHFLNQQRQNIFNHQKS